MNLKFKIYRQRSEKPELWKVGRDGESQKRKLKGPEEDETKTKEKYAVRK